MNEGRRRNRGWEESGGGGGGGVSRGSPKRQAREAAEAAEARGRGASLRRRERRLLRRLNTRDTHGCDSSERKGGLWSGTAVASRRLVLGDQARGDLLLQSPELDGEPARSELEQQRVRQPAPPARRAGEVGLDVERGEELQAGDRVALEVVERRLEQVWRGATVLEACPRLLLRFWSEAPLKR